MTEYEAIMDRIDRYEEDIHDIFLDLAKVLFYPFSSEQERYSTDERIRILRKLKSRGITFKIQLPLLYMPEKVSFDMQPKDIIMSTSVYLDKLLSEDNDRNASEDNSTAPSEDVNQKPLENKHNREMFNIDSKVEIVTYKNVLSWFDSQTGTFERNDQDSLLSLLIKTPAKERRTFLISSYIDAHIEDFRNGKVVYSITNELKEKAFSLYLENIEQESSDDKTRCVNRNFSLEKYCCLISEKYRNKREKLKLDVQKAIESRDVREFARLLDLPVRWLERIEHFLEVKTAKGGSALLEKELHGIDPTLLDNRSMEEGSPSIGEVLANK